jgi:hypothetical protein
MMDRESKPQSATFKATGSRPTIRYLIAIAITLVVSCYAFRIVAGKIPKDQKLSGVDLGLILVSTLAIVFLLRPEFLDRLTHLRVGSVEFELQKLKSDQQIQRSELDDVRFVLTLLLQEREIQHLRALEEGSTKDYVGNHDVRTDLRKLRTLGLIRNFKDHKIAELADNCKLDLKTVVELTERGQKYLERLGEYKKDVDT